MLSPTFRSDHEPEYERIIRLVIDHLEGRCELSSIKTQLVERDKRLWLEMESCHLLGYVAEVLRDAFPASLFIVTIRDPLSWLRSRLNYHYAVNTEGTPWQEYRDYFWYRRHEGYPSEESILAEYDLCSLDTYLNQYADHYKRVFSAIPPERCLVIRTKEISDNIERIGNFLAVESSRLSVSHRNRRTDKIEPLSEIDSRYVRELVVRHCSELIDQYFPDVLD